MTNYGFNAFGSVLVFFFWCILPIAWIVLSIYTLLAVKRVPLNETARALWALLIVLVPILGAVAYWLVRPDEGAGGVG
jgi:phospholipase D-like protein